MIAIDLIVVGIGGFIGTILRMELKERWNPPEAGGFPTGTFGANILACFLLGTFLPVIDDPSFRLLVISGFLGSLSTFSMFILEHQTMRRSDQLMSFLYLGGSMVCGIVAFVSGDAFSGWLPL